MAEMTSIFIIAMALAYILPLLGSLFAYNRYKKMHEKKEEKK